MEFASKHVYLGAVEEAEVDDEVLDSVEQMQQQQSLQQAEAPQAQQQQSSVRKKSGAGFFSKLFSGSSSSSAAPPPPAPAAAASSAPPRSSVLDFLAKKVGSGEVQKNRVQSEKAERDRRQDMEVDDAEGMSGQQDDSFAASAPASAAAAGAVPAHKRKSAAAYKRAVDTNLLAIKFSTLATSSDDVFAGDVQLCSNPKCGAALNNLSRIVDHQGQPMRPPPPSQQQHAQVAPGGIAVGPDSAPAAASAASSSSPVALPAGMVLAEGQCLWECDFCAHPNILEGLQPAEIPRDASRDYVLVPAPEPDVKGSEGGAAGSGDADDSVVVFCVDVSGSMCVSAPVPGRIKLRGGAKALDPAALGLDEVDMSGVGARARETYISRLQAVQHSIEKQVREQAVKHPHRRVCLVTFAGEVVIRGLGGGQGAAAEQEVTITGDKLNDEATLRQIGSSVPLGQSIGAAGVADSLCEALYALEESGPTALGPALVVSLSLASRRRGSTVIICTDGVANVGVGAIDSPAKEIAAEAWYDTQGSIARDAGLIVNVMSIKGDECRLELLGRVADQSEGQVVRVDPLDLVGEIQANNARGNSMASLLANPVVATNVEVTFILHEGLSIRGEQEAMQQQQQKKQAAASAAAGASGAPAAPPSLHKLTRVIGNVYRDSETALEYGLRSPAELSRYAHLSSLPFQAHITYTSLSGMRVLRVLTAAQPVTLDRLVAERDVRIELLSAQVASKSAALARDGRYREARMNWMAATPMLSRAAQSPQQQQVYSNYAANIDAFDRAVAQQHRREKEAGGDDDEEEEQFAGARADAPAPVGMAASSSSSQIRRSKKAKQSDECYRVIHQTRQLNSAGLM